MRSSLINAAAAAEIAEVVQLAVANLYRALRPPQGIEDAIRRIMHMLRFEVPEILARQ
jgi:hypothetical protein